MSASAKPAKGSAVQVTKQGWLIKRGGMRKNWKRRFFVLRQTAERSASAPEYRLYYLEDEAQPLEKARGVIPLQDASVCVIRPATFGRSHCFAVAPKGGVRNYYIMASSDSDRQGWVDQIIACGGSLTQEEALPHHEATAAGAAGIASSSATAATTSSSSGTDTGRVRSMLNMFQQRLSPSASSQEARASNVVRPSRGGAAGGKSTAFSRARKAFLGRDSSSGSAAQQQQQQQQQEEKQQQAVSPPASRPAAKTFSYPPSQSSQYGRAAANSPSSPASSIPQRASVAQSNVHSAGNGATEGAREAVAAASKLGVGSSDSAVRERSRSPSPSPVVDEEKQKESKQSATAQRGQQQEQRGSTSPTARPSEEKKDDVGPAAPTSTQVHYAPKGREHSVQQARREDDAEDRNGLAGVASPSASMGSTNSGWSLPSTHPAVAAAAPTKSDSVAAASPSESLGGSGPASGDGKQVTGSAEVMEMVDMVPRSRSHSAATDEILRRWTAEYSLPEGHQEYLRPALLEAVEERSKDRMIEALSLLEQCVSSPYRLEERIGKGAYGLVYRGRDLKNGGRTVAIKVIDLEETSDDITVINREIVALTQGQNCPQLTNYFGSAVFGTKLWIVMEYQDGGSVLDLIKNVMLEEKHMQVITREVLLGLKYLHDNRQIHRDIKCANILLSRSGRVTLADFGATGSLSNTMTKCNTVIGSPYWMAPEVMTENKYDGKADVWSLGITLIEMINGKPPYADIHPLRVINIIPTKPPPLQEIDESGFSDDFKTFLRQCLTKNSKHRPDVDFLLKHPWIRKAGSTDLLKELWDEY